MDNKLAARLCALVAVSMLGACGGGSDDGKKDVEKDLNFFDKEIKALTQPKAYDAFSSSNPNTKVDDSLKDKVAHAKAVKMDKDGEVLQYVDSKGNKYRIDSVNKGITLGDDTLFKIVGANSQSEVHNRPANEMRLIYNTPWMALNMRYREATAPGTVTPKYGMFDLVDITGYFTTPEQMDAAFAKGGSISYKGIAFTQDKPAHLHYGDFSYTVDLGAKEGSGEITNVGGIKDYLIKEDGSYGQPDTGSWIPDIDKVVLEKTKLDLRNSTNNIAKVNFSGGKGVATIKSSKHDDKPVEYFVAFGGPEMQSVAGSVVTDAHGAAKGFKGALPFFGMKTK